MITVLMSLALVVVVGAAGFYFSAKMDEMIANDDSPPTSRRGA